MRIKGVFIFPFAFAAEQILSPLVNQLYLLNFFEGVQAEA